MPSLRPAWRLTRGLLLRSHPNALDGLEQLALGSNARGDDNLGLLKLRNISSTDITHAGSDRTDQILAAVVYFRGAEENLLQ